MLELEHYLKAGSPIIWVKSADYAEAMRRIRKAIARTTFVTQQGKRIVKQCRVWSVADNLTEDKVGNLLEQPCNPVTPLKAMEQAVASNTPSVFVLYDYHKFINQPHIWRSLLVLADKMAPTCSNIVILSPVVTVPPEIENYVTVINMPLPTKEELAQLTVTTLQRNNISPEGLDIDAVVSYGLGLSNTAYLNALYLLLASLPVTTENARMLIKSQKENILAQTDLLRALDSEENFTSIQGMDVMKNFTKRMIAGGLGRGILILGVPGGGKTAFCSCLGNETGRPVLQMDFSRLMGGIVGETEAKTATALEMVDAMQPAILFIDEIEKGLAGTTGGNGDSGTSKRQGGQFLKWLSDHKSDVYVVATANDLSALPSEFLRAERWDTIFFVDVPDADQALAIFDMYKEKYGLEQDNTCSLQDIAGWTGAEIKSLCRIAKGTDISLHEAMSMVVPMCKVAGDKLDALRKAASKFAIPANAVSHTADTGSTAPTAVFGVNRGY